MKNIIHFLFPYFPFFSFLFLFSLPLFFPFPFSSFFLYFFIFFIPFPFFLFPSFSPVGLLIRFIDVRSSPLSLSLSLSLSTQQSTSGRDGRRRESGKGGVSGGGRR
jgi:hypothetical protein